MKNLGKISVIVLFLLSIFVGSFTVYSISKVQSYGTLINYLGIVRGATQRLVKLELQQQPHDELIAYIDDIIYDLKNTDGKYGLEKIPNVDYQQQFSALNTLWHRVKSNIYAVRQNPANSPLLLQSSEVHFEIANNTVFAADNYTTSKSHQLTLLSALMLAGIIIMWIALFMVYLRKLYSLESSNKTLYDITTKDPLTGAYNFETFKKHHKDLKSDWPRTRLKKLREVFMKGRVETEVYLRECRVRGYVLPKISDYMDEEETGYYTDETSPYFDVIEMLDIYFDLGVE